MNSVITFNDLAQRTRREIVVCNNPYHAHPSPVHEMFATNYRGHRVSVTINGNEYSVRIDNDPLTDKYGLTFDELEAYVERSCPE